MNIEILIYTVISVNFLLSGTGVLFFRNPVNAVISLIVLFINGAFLLALHYVEFFAILYLLVYVGAIVIFFLFVVMLLDLKKLSGIYPNFFLYSFLVFLGFLLLFTLFSSIFIVIDVKYLLYNTFSLESIKTFSYSVGVIYESVYSVAFYLYTEYYLIIIWSAVLLFISMLGAVELNANKAVTKFKK